ncbi:hypothetical protein ACNKHW_03310 [Shigella flexneri]
MATLAPNGFFFFMSPYRSFASVRMFRPLMNRLSTGIRPTVPSSKTRRAVCRCQSAGHQKSGDGRGDSLESTSAFVAVWPNVAIVLPPGKTDLSPPFYPQPVAERGRTPAIPERTTLTDGCPRRRTLPATPQVSKVVLSRLIDITTDAAIDSGVLLNG